MISRVLINKSPTFSYLELYMQSGFNVISGVSGSGKSVFLNSILSAFGLKEPNAELIEITLNIDFTIFGIDLALLSAGCIRTACARPADGRYGRTGRPRRA